MKLASLATAALLTSSCARYSDFKLPPQSGPSGKVSWSWEVRPDPVLPRGAVGAWDDTDTLNPTITRFQRKLWNLYSGYDGKVWHTGGATSEDGLNWVKKGKLLSPNPSTWEGDYIAANGAVIEIADKLYYWYQGGRVPQIGLATSSDGVLWSKREQPVLETGPRGSWDERGVADPYVVKVAGTLYLYYLGQDRARRQRLGVARSEDGVHWEKLRTNPILELGEPSTFDEIGLGEPAVWESHGWYWMLYTGRDRREHRRLGLAQSRDGVRWTRVTEQAVLSGELPWNAKVVCDPHVEVDGESLLVWYGGGDTAQPAENLHGQIGFARLKLSVATLAK